MLTPRRVGRKKEKGRHSEVVVGQVMQEAVNTWELSFDPYRRRSIVLIDLIIVHILFEGHG